MHPAKLDSTKDTYSLVWILLRLIVAVLPLSCASGLAGAACISRLVLTAGLGGRARPLLTPVVVVRALVVIPVIARLVLGVVLILIPAITTVCTATCCCIATLSVPALIVVVSAATLVAASVPSDVRVGVLVSLRVLS